MTFSIDDVISEVTEEQWLASIFDDAAGLGLDTTSWEDGTPERVILTILAKLCVAFQTTDTEAIKAKLLDHASGGWLTLWARDNYCDENGDPVERILASNGTTTVRLTNAALVPYPIIAGDVTLQNSATTKTYRNMTPLVATDIPAGGYLDVEVMAEEAGTASNAGAGEIDTVVSSMLGVTCSNATALVATDDETDADLKARCRASLASASIDGPALAYYYVARSTLRPDGSTVAITRVSVSASSSTGAVTVYLADADGAPEASDVTLVDAEIQAKVVPLTATVTVAGATEVTIAPTYTAYVPTTCTLSDAELKAAIAASLAAWFATIQIGGNKTTPGATGYVFHDLLQARITDAAADIFTSTLSVPAGNTALTAGQVPVLGTITGTIVRVAQ